MFKAAKQEAEDKPYIMVDEKGKECSSDQKGCEMQCKKVAGTPWSYFGAGCAQECICDQRGTQGCARG